MIKIIRAILQNGGGGINVRCQEIADQNAEMGISAVGGKCHNIATNITFGKWHLHKYECGCIVRCSKWIQSVSSIAESKWLKCCVFLSMRYKLWLNGCHSIEEHLIRNQRKANVGCCINKSAVTLKRGWAAC